jgi:hypothetical protein
MVLQSSGDWLCKPMNCLYFLTARIFERALAKKLIVTLQNPHMTQRSFEVENGKSFIFQPQKMRCTSKQSSFKIKPTRLIFPLSLDLYFPLSQESFFCFFYINLSSTYYIKILYFILKSKYI